MLCRYELGNAITQCCSLWSKIQREPSSTIPTCPFCYESGLVQQNLHGIRCWNFFFCLPGLTNLAHHVCKCILNENKMFLPSCSYCLGNITKFLCKLTSVTSHFVLHSSSFILHNLQAGIMQSTFNSLAHLAG